MLIIINYLCFNATFSRSLLSVTSCLCCLSLKNKQQQQTSKQSEKAEVSDQAFLVITVSNV